MSPGPELAFQTLQEFVQGNALGADWIDFLGLFHFEDTMPVDHAGDVRTRSRQVVAEYRQDVEQGEPGNHQVAEVVQVMQTQRSQHGRLLEQHQAADAAQEHKEEQRQVDGPPERVVAVPLG